MLIVFAAILPALVLIFFIYRKDPVKEPALQLIRGFAYGVISAFLATILASPLMVIGLVSQEPNGLVGSVSTAFLGAAIPEELAKLFMLWLLLRKNRYFDEYFDGIVYAASIGLGFAAFENVLYLFSDVDNWFTIAVMRGIFSVPAHFAFAVLMGYFYSLIHIGGHHSQLNKFLVIAAPVLAHGTFDAIIFVWNTGGWLASLLSIAFLLLCWKLVVVCKKHIRVLTAFDKMPKPIPPLPRT